MPLFGSPSCGEWNVPKKGRAAYLYAGWSQDSAMCWSPGFSRPSTEPHRKRLKPGLQRI